jgi:hypothetical protein
VNCELTGFGFGFGFGIGIGFELRVASWPGCSNRPAGQRNIPDMTLHNLLPLLEFDV